MSFADQALVSLTNLGIGLFFVHYTTKNDYAYYSIGFGVISLVLGFSNALINTPMLVTAEDDTNQNRTLRCKTMLVAMWIYFTPTVLLVAALFYCIIDEYLTTRPHQGFIIAIAGASLCACFQEYFRRYYFMILQPHRVLIMDIIFAAMIFFTLICYRYQEKSEMYTYGIVAYGSAAFCAGGIGYINARLTIQLTRSSARQAVCDCWKNGNWSLGGVTVTWIQNQCYTYFLALTGASSSLAEANAARLLLSPISLLSTSVKNVMMPRMVKLRADGDNRGTLRQGGRIASAMVAILLVYSGLVYGFKEPLISLILGKEYGNSGPYIIAWVIVLLLQTMRVNASSLLQVFREFRNLALANFWSAAFVLCTTYFFIRGFGPIGSLFALSGGEFMLTAILLLALRMHIRSLESSTANR